MTREPAALVAFVAFLLLGCVSGWWLKDRAMAGRVGALQNQISDYKRRLGIVSVDPSSYATLTDEDLRRIALQHAQNLRALHRDWLEAQRSRGPAAGSAKAADDFSAKYAEMYAAKGRALTLELRKRVARPPDPEMMGGELVLMSGMLAGANPLTSAAASLEELAGGLAKR